MLLYYLFGMFMGFTKHFYIIFGTNLLTQSPVPISVFPCFRVSQKRKIKRNPIDLKLHRTYFWTRRSPRSIGVGPGESRRQNRSGVPPPEATVATENQSTPIPAPCRRGNPSPVAIFIIPVLSMTRRE